MPAICVDYGHDQHQIDVDQDTYRKIRAGEPISIDGQGLVYDEEGLVPDHWVFNSSPGEIYIWLDNGAEFHAREI